jgi:uncharacterized membrane protein
MLFTLKKYIGGMMLPLPLLLIIIALGLALVWFSRFQKSGKTITSAGCPAAAEPAAGRG